MSQLDFQNNLSGFSHTTATATSTTSTQPSRAQEFLVTNPINVAGVWLYCTPSGTLGNYTFRARHFTNVGSWGGAAGGTTGVDSTFGPSTVVNITGAGWYYLPFSTPITANPQNNLGNNLRHAFGFIMDAQPAGASLNLNVDSTTGDWGGLQSNAPQVTPSGSGVTVYMNEDWWNVNAGNDNTGMLSIGLRLTWDTAPNAPTITSPANNAKLNTRTPTVTWTFSDPDAGDTQSAYYVEVINSTYSASVWNSGWQTGSATSYAIPAGAITSDNNYYIRMQVKDSSGVVNIANGPGPGGGDANFYNVYVTIDTTAPTGSISTASPQYLNVAAGGTFRVQVTASDSLSGISNVQFPTWTEANGQDDIIWYNGTNAGGGVWYIDVPISDHSNAEGIYDTDPYLYDNAGNSVGIGRVQTYVDRTNPTIGSVDGTQYSNVGTGSQRVTAYTVSDATSGVLRTDFWYRKSTDNGATWGAWVGPVTGTQSGSNWYYDVPKSAGDGYYQVDIRAYDRAGNVSNSNTAVTTYFYVDTTKPNDPNPSAPKYTTTTVMITWNAFSDPAPSTGYSSTNVYVDLWNGSAYIGIAGSPFSVGNVTSYTVSGLTPGAQYRITVAQYDIAGNQGNFTWQTFTTKKKIGEYHFEGASLIVLPVYDPASGVIHKDIRVETQSGIIGCFELVPTTDPNASPIRIKTQTNGTMSISK